MPSRPAFRKRLKSWKKSYDNITSCRVVIELPHHSQNKGNLYQTTIYLSVPGGAIEVAKGNRKNHSHEDAYISIRDSFCEAARQLGDHLDKRRHQVKTHTS
jgi:ribosome-associated translation inhibitor RaiA